MSDIINEPVIIEEEYIVLLSYYEKTDEVHVHFRKLPTTQKGLQDMNEDLDILTKQLKTQFNYNKGLFSLSEAENKRAKQIARLVGASPLEKVVYNHVKYLRFNRR